MPSLAHPAFYSAKKMLSLLPPRQNIVLLTVLLTCLLLYLTFSPPSFWDQDVLLHATQPSQRNDATSLRSPHLPFLSAHDAKLNQIQNATLGFQEIFMISLPSRTDKRDTFAMQAALSSIKYVQIDGVDGHNVPQKALPHVSHLMSISWPL